MPQAQGPSSAANWPDLERDGLAVLAAGDPDGKPFALAVQAKHNAQRALAEALGLDGSSAGSLLESFFARALVGREEVWSPVGHRRVTVVVVTDAGQ